MVSNEDVKDNKRMRPGKSELLFYLTVKLQLGAVNYVVSDVSQLGCTGHCTIFIWTCGAALVWTPTNALLKHTCNSQTGSDTGTVGDGVGMCD